MGHRFIESASHFLESNLQGLATLPNLFRRGGVTWVRDKIHPVDDCCSVAVVGILQEFARCAWLSRLIRMTFGEVREWLAGGL
jgi:hypothetical protein